MARLVDRARAAMNLVIVTSLLVLWAVSQESINVINIGMSIHSTAERISFDSDESYKHEGIISFRRSVDDLLKSVRENSGDNLREKIGNVSASTILAARPPSTNNILPASLVLRAIASGALVLMEDELASRKGQGDVEDVVNDNSVSINAFIWFGSEALANEVDHLDRLMSDAELSEQLTLQEVQNRLSKKITIPFIEQELPIVGAIPLIAAALLVPLLYLLSLCGAMKLAAERVDNHDGIDWVFFHPGILGLVVGIAWLAAPGLVVLFGTVYFQSVQMGIGIPLVVGLVIIATLIVIRAVRARRVFLAYLPD